MTTEDAANTIKSIAILGGTGDLGGGLARQWSRAGYQILIGSRTEEKAGMRIISPFFDAQDYVSNLEVA